MKIPMFGRERPAKLLRYGVIFVAIGVVVFIDKPQTNSEIALAAGSVCYLGFELASATLSRRGDEPRVEVGGHALVGIALVLQSLRFSGLEPVLWLFPFVPETFEGIVVLLGGIGIVLVWYSDSSNSRTQSTNRQANE